ncbi:head completion/stabilization protein [Pseudomonas sp. PA15(2017)]|uniref:head completion/stabilization protein n=1 Tax=Pseudomonas sp. PA15(2017) TaxID=1932111 RepID=UPI000966539F|nr:head completion/stabilization protein [Pseudomonas sp. PA15(2017)]OLU22468.1 head completion/stabilization protein [Pseudomonas sp. PA15(2017)]
MSAFVAGSVAAPFQHLITNDGFWPDIDIADLRDAQRINSNVTDARLETAVVNAMVTANRELVARKLRYQAQGHTSLEAVPADQIGERSILAILYQRAIYSATSAELAERYRSFDATNSGAAKAEEETPTIDDYRRDSRFALRDLLGVSRTTVELL